MNRALREFEQSHTPAPTQGTDAQGRGALNGADMKGLPPLPSTGFSYGNLEFEGNDYDWGDYYRQIYLIIWKAWHNRLYQTSDRFERWAHAGGGWALDNEGRVRFTIGSTGQILEVAIETSSGCTPLDEATYDTLKEVVLPPLPPDFKRDSETVRYRFLAEGDTREMRRYLSALKGAGYF